MAQSARPRPSSDNRPPRRPVLPTRSGGPRFGFFQDTANELKKVVWPTRQTTTRLSVVVIATSAALGLLLGGFDWAFTQIMQQFLVPSVPLG